MRRAAGSLASRNSGFLPPDSAGLLAADAIPMGRTDETLGAVCSRLLGQRFDSLDVILVLDENGRYFGAANASDVVGGDAGATLSSAVTPGWPLVAPETGQEFAADVAIQGNVAALPVVTGDGRVLGCILPKALLSVIAREHQEDLHRLSGILHDSSDAVHALEDPPFRRMARRLPWLLAGLILSALAAMIMAGYEDALRANVAISFFIPSLVYLADAIGTQTETIAVRGLSLRSRSLGELLRGEMLTCGLIGLILGGLALLTVWIFFSDFLLACGVGISLVIAGTLASAIGLLMPWSLLRFGIDPAFGSGPVATIVQDVLTIALYFQVMAMLVI